MRAIIAIFICTLTLSACAPVMVAATAGGVATVYDKRTLSTIYQDEGITYQALGQLKKSKQLKDSHINVVSINKVALIVGQTPTKTAKNIAYTIVKSIPEVRKVYNQITIGKPTSPRVRSNDAWITTKVKAAMLAENGLPSTQVKVLTENSIVYLLGVVDTKQADLAAQVAKNIKGVKKVVKLFQKKPQTK